MGPWESQGSLGPPQGLSVCPGSPCVGRDGESGPAFTAVGSELATGSRPGSKWASQSHTQAGQSCSCTRFLWAGFSLLHTCLVSVSLFVPEWWAPHVALSRLYLHSGNKSTLDTVKVRKEKKSGLPGGKSWTTGSAVRWPLPLVFVPFMWAEGKRDSQQFSLILKMLRALAWDPHQGHRHRVKPSSSGVEHVPHLTLDFAVNAQTWTESHLFLVLFHLTCIIMAEIHDHGRIFPCEFVASLSSVCSWRVTPLGSFCLVWLTPWQLQVTVTESYLFWNASWNRSGRTEGADEGPSTMLLFALWGSLSMDC